MKIGILGTRGIPNFHGGFEQFAENFSVFLHNAGHEVYVYNSNTHPYQDNVYKGVNIVHCYDPENKIGTAGQFIYDFNCILDSRKRDFDILLQLGYTSNSVFYKFLPQKSIIITNMDGLEWKRSKYSKKVQKFLKLAEKMAVKSSDFLISDSIGIQNYLSKTYKKDSEYIAYGAEVITHFNQNILNDYNVAPYNFNMLIARLEPENNIETILEGVVSSKSKMEFLVIGKYDTSRFGKYLYEKFGSYKQIKFLGGIYDQDHLNNLRYYSNLYFHGHSVGGTNPSLLEAMATQSLIVANSNEFNRSILKENAFYFKNRDEVAMHCNTLQKQNHREIIENNLNSIEQYYNWNKINNQYLNFFNDCLERK